MLQKKLLLLSFTFLIFSISLSQNTFIPDNNFEQELINLGFDSGPLDNFVPTINISSITNLDINLKNISDLTGIEDFRELSIFDCSRNQLTNFDISKNTKLTQLYCHGNKLTSLDVTKNLSLEVLWCYSNLISDINVAFNPNMISLVCWANNLTSLNTSNNPELVVLGCEINRITSLDLSNNLKLNRFQCRDNLLSDLDLTNNKNLTHLDCGFNNLSNLNLSNNSELNTLLCSSNKITELNLTTNSKLRNVECIDNNLCIINIKNGNNGNIAYMNFDLNSNLNCVVVDSASDDHSLWEPLTFSNYVNNFNLCGNGIPVDNLENFTGTSFTLPFISNGRYFTEPNGGGVNLNPGTIISTSIKLYIYNESGCNSNQSSFNIFITAEDYIIPKYFTPNNDGTNDIWKVYDSNNLINRILIFNRYGKLLKSLNTNSDGWNGTFNGNLLKSDDYWYQILLKSGEIIKGHFTLKR